MRARAQITEHPVNEWKTVMSECLEWIALFLKIFLISLFIIFFWWLLSSDVKANLLFISLDVIFQFGAERESIDLRTIFDWDNIFAKNKNIVLIWLIYSWWQCVCCLRACVCPSVDDSSMVVRSAKAGRWAWPSRTTTTGSSWATSPRTGTGTSSTRTLTSLHVSLATKSKQVHTTHKPKNSPIFQIRYRFKQFPTHLPSNQILVRFDSICLLFNQNPKQNKKKQKEATYIIII